MKDSGNVNFVATCRLGVTGGINGVGFRPTDNDIHGLSLDEITGSYVPSLSQKNTIQNNTQEGR